MQCKVVYFDLSTSVCEAKFSQILLFPSKIFPSSMVDMISSLPDSILSHILSFLPTNNAVATSILSNRWKFLWRAVFNIDLCQDTKEKPEEDLKFVEFVNHVLLHLDGGFLNKFRLVWKPLFMPLHISYLLIPWIGTAIARNLNELSLFIENLELPLEIPSSVFSCGTLKSVEFKGNLLISDQIVVCLPRVESLELVSVYFESDEALKKLISGCTALNYLQIDINLNKMIEFFRMCRHTGPVANIFTFIISSTSLRRFKLYVFSESFEPDDLPHCSLELETPSLEYLNVVGLISRIFVRETLSSLYAVDIGIETCMYEFSEYSACNSLVEVVRALDFAKALSLSRRALWALSHATICLSTKFNRLTELDTEAHCCYCDPLQDFIQSSDSLEVLTIDMCGYCTDEEYHTYTSWTTPDEVPRCLSNSLKTVYCYGYSGFKYEREMIGYILEHGSVLELMHISCKIDRDDAKFELLRDLCEFPRKSPCKVKFIT